MGVHRSRRGGGGKLVGHRKPPRKQSWWYADGVRAGLARDLVVIWIQTLWCPVPQRVFTHPNVSGGRSEMRDLVEGIVCHMLRKSDAPRPAALSPAVTQDDAWAIAYPGIWSYLTQTVWEDGTARETSSLLLFVEGGSLKMMLRDKANSVCLWVAGTSLSNVFEIMEAKLFDPQADWRVDRQQKGQPASRVRKTS